MEKCLFCGEAQITCINPECKAPFKKAMDVCEKCQAPQQLSQEPPPPSMEVQILCINPKCKAPLDSENSETCKKCDTPQREIHPPSSQPQTTCSNSGCNETLDGSGESELCSKCIALQKQAQQQSMDAQVVEARVCVNPKCRVPLPNKEDKVCNKCEAPQTLCINPECKQPLFTLNQGMCHECLSSQEPDQQISNASVTGKTAGGDPDKRADGAPQPSSTPMETGNSTTHAATPQKLIFGDSSVDKINPTTATKSDTVTSAKGATSSKAKEKKENANISQGSKAATTAAESEKKGQPPPKDSTVTPTDKPAKSKSNASSRQSSKSSMTSDSEESSDSDEFTTPPASAMLTTTDRTDSKGDDKCTSDGAGASNVAVSQINLTRLTLDDTKGRKHNRDHDETEESSSSKRRALQDDEEPRLSPKAVSSIKDGESTKVKKPETEKKLADKHKGSGQKQKDGESSGAQGKGGTGSTQEVCVLALTIPFTRNLCGLCEFNCRPLRI
jgi:hypothetical protein